MKNNVEEHKGNMEMLKKINEILLNHKGKQNRITAGKIALALGINEDATHAKTRALIFECAKKYELPLAANNRGYYLITCQKEYDEYMANLNSRKAGIEERQEIITKNFDKDKTV